MATGRIGVTPVLRTRWSKLPTTGTTVLSGLDDNSVALVYDVGYEAVYRNGVLLSRGNDYTATNGTTVTLIDATLAGDVVEIFANDLVPLTDAISKGQYNAKGALLSATAASTPAVLPVGTNDQVLTADSTTSTGLKWATAAAGGMTLLSTTTLSGASTTISSINQSYKHLLIVIYGVTNATSDGQIGISPNNRNDLTSGQLVSRSVLSNQTGTKIYTSLDIARDNNFNTTQCWIYNYANTTFFKPYSLSTGYIDSSSGAQRGAIGGGHFMSTSAITSLVFDNYGGNFLTGTVLLYGVS